MKQNLAFQRLNIFLSPHESYEDFQIFSVVRRDQMYKTNNWVPIARFSM